MNDRKGRSFRPARSLMCHKTTMKTEERLSSKEPRFPIVLKGGHGGPAMSPSPDFNSAASIVRRSRSWATPGPWSRSSAGITDAQTSMTLTGHHHPLLRGGVRSVR